MNSRDGGLTVQLLVILSVGVLTGGCRSVSLFREHPVQVHESGGSNQLISFDIDKDGREDYWQRYDANGRKVELRFSRETDEPTEIVWLDKLNCEDIPHLIVALDGVPYQLVSELYEQGCFRLFHPPSRVVSCFPGMTNPAFQRIFGGEKPSAYESKYFDREKNRLVGGSNTYLTDELSDWAKELDYHCSSTLDVLAYVKPATVLQHELNEIAELLGKTKSGTRIAYSVGTAGLGTRGGKEAILEYLTTIDQWCEQLVYERRGRVRITLLADHGHSASGEGRISFKQLLKTHGYRLCDRLAEANDVVTVEFGLVNYAAFYTRNPSGVARVLLTDPRATIACYPADAQAIGAGTSEVIVQTKEGRAMISEKQGRYSYKVEYGDPLELLEVIRHLRQQGQVDSQDFIEDRAIFDATLDHTYPDPLRRIWLAFNGLVQQPPDLIVCLKDGWVHGSGFFYKVLNRVASTHGSLNTLNSMTFAMTMLGELPPALRLEEVMPNLDELHRD